MPIKCYISSDNDVTVEELTIANTGAYANAATVSASILTSAGATVTDSTTTLTYVTESNGKYFGSIPSTVVLTDAANYFLQITASQSGKDITIRIPFVAGYYQGCE
jgi:hypothetical protein